MKWLWNPLCSSTFSEIHKRKNFFHTSNHFQNYCFVHKVVHRSNNSTAYLSSAFWTTKHSRNTRFNCDNTLKGIFTSGLGTVGARSLFITLRELWNLLPLKLREIPSLTTYKSHLETNLFKQSYNL